jgi:hypothetical protein
MKPPLSTALLTIFSIILLTISLSGCKQKGCTDKNALNYNSVAGEDDGSCLYCQTQVTKADTNEYSFLDGNYDNGNNPYYNNYIGKVYSVTRFISYNDIKCGNNLCTTSVIIQNLIGRTFSFSARFQLYGIDTLINNISVPAFGNINIGKTFSLPSLTNCGANNVDFFISGTFIYH